MQKVLTAAQMREVDRLTTEDYGIPSILLMENAAHAVVRVIAEKVGGSVKGKSILILCGKGNNGGDGAAIARQLWTAGARLTVFFFGKLEETKADARINLQILENISSGVGKPGGEFNKFRIWDADEDLISELDRTLHSDEVELVVDALFGTGLTRELSGNYVEAIRALEKRRLSVISVDIPSGLNADLGEKIGPNVAANITVTFTAPKPGNILPDVAGFNGELIVADIGSPELLVDAQPSRLYLAERTDAENWLDGTKFTDDSYKNKRGHALVIAGSDSYSGAAVLAGNAAMRSGVGLVTIATPRSSKDSIASRVLPEIMVRGVAETVSGSISEEAVDKIAELLAKADSVAIGSGISQDESTKRFVENVIENRPQPMIVDADALNLLSPFAGTRLNGGSKFPLILTPHEGEFMRLLGSTDKEIIKDRVAAVREFATTHQVILVLKGQRVLIGEPGGKVVVNPTGNSGLGKAGNGDTLTGILAGFAAQAAQMNIDMFEAVVAAVYVAGMAGDAAEKKYGKRVMTASDVRECLTEVFEVLTGDGSCGGHIIL